MTFPPESKLTYLFNLSKRISTTLRIGRNLSEQLNLSKAVSPEIPVPSPSLRQEIFTIGSWPSFLCCLDTGRNMPTLSSPSREQRQLRWHVGSRDDLSDPVADGIIQVYERGVASVTNSVDLWTNYCAFKVDTTHDPDVIRE